MHTVTYAAWGNQISNYGTLSSVNSTPYYPHQLPNREVAGRNIDTLARLDR